MEWTRLEGGQVEAVVAMFVNREHPNSVRITPSRGDGGVDILDRGAGPEGGDVVYQVKRYTGKLTPRQKKDIEDSLETLQAELQTEKRWESLTVEEWYLVTPWDPTPETETWLQGLGQAGIKKIWHGLTWVDQQAAKYDDVIDYYLHDGRALVERTHAEVMALLGTDQIGPGLTVPEVAERLEKAIKTLDHDPHYRYEPHFGEGTPPPPPREGERPGLVLHCMDAVEGGRWTSVDIIARCAASTAERPITIKGTFKAEPDSEFARQLEDFLTYGAPFTSPEGAFDGEIDAPGGLGGPLKGAIIRTGPTAHQDLGKNPDLHLEVLDPEEAVVGEADVRRVVRSQGIMGGARAVLEETNGLFSIEDRYDLKNSQVHRSLTFGDFVGHPVAVAYGAMKFVSQLHSPNRLRISVRHTPPARGIIDASIGFDRQGEALQYIGAVTGALETLAFLQQHASELILTPEFGTLSREQFSSWHRAGKLLRGKELAGSYPDGQCLFVELGSEVTPTEGEDLQIQLPLTVCVGEQKVDLGYQVAVLPTPTLLERRKRDDVVVHAFTTPDRRIRWRRDDPEIPKTATKQP
ncbi:hypothetical protein JS278_03076 [Acidipropionibacterium virtanenii]|uniref:Restriction endonuclease type IV Mrr domain-containing protein n=1 Tax=Acidipropionibacterium virtanenii TaxID=2057246 RepID=A0A344UY62_9ACTN|nr:hypothetical protein JS278_03076 [Acidipropionibacterium virtanenii]